MNKAKTSLAVVGLVCAAGLAWWVQNRPAKALAESGQAAAAGPRGASAAGGGGGAAGGPGGAGGPAPVEVSRAETIRLEDDAQAVGSLRSNQGVMLRPESSGRIARLAFKDGQRVRRGQLLVQLDDTLQRAQMQQAQAQANIAQTNLQRNRELQAQGFVSQSAVDQTAATLEVARAQLALARAQLDRMRVLAPFDAVVGIRMVNLGDYVKDGADLVNLEDLSSVWVDFRLPERTLGRLRPGQPVQVAVDALPGRSFNAKVGALDSQLDANGRSVLVRARLEDASGTLRPGMFARARIVFATREQALVVPEEALVPQGSKQFVFKVVDGPGGSKTAQRVEAQLGHRVPGKVEVLSGLAPGDTVVVAGHARLLRGENLPVKVVDLARPAARPGSGPASGTPRPGNGAAPA